SAVSPGSSTWRAIAVPAFTARFADVPSTVEPTAVSAAVIVAAEVAVTRVTLMVRRPAISWTSAGSVAWLSLLVTWTVGVAVDTRFRYASTARTVTPTVAPAAIAVGVPVRPV